MDMKRLSILLALLLCEQAWAGTLHIATTGNDTTGDGASLATAYLTIQKGVDSAPSGATTVYVHNGTYNDADGVVFDSGENGKTITVQGESRAGVVLTTDGATSVVDVPGSGGVTTGTFTLQDLTISDDDNDPSYGIRVANIAANLTVSNCSIVNAKAGGQGIYLLNNTGTETRNLTVTNSSITATSHCIYVDGAANVSISGGSLTTSGSGTSCVLLGSIITGKAVISGVAMTSAADGYAVNTWNSGTGLTLFGDYLPYLEMSSCTGTVGNVIVVPSRVKRALFSGNVMTSTLSASSPVHVGTEVTADDVLDSNPYPFDKWVIRNNTLTFSGANVTHMVFVGVGADNSDLINNTLATTVSTQDYGVVLKSDNLLVQGNRIMGAGTSLYISGSSNSRAINNTVYARTGTAVVIDSNQERTAGTDGTYGQCRRTELRDNVIVSADGLPLSVDAGGDDASNAWNLYVDYNCYWTLDGSSPQVANIGGTAVTQVAGDNAAITARWAAFQGTEYGWALTNDTHSVVADPRLISVDSTSPLFLYVPFSSPAAVGLNRSMGAYQPTTTGGARFRRVR